MKLGSLKVMNQAKRIKKLWPSLGEESLTQKYIQTFMAGIRLFLGTNGPKKFLIKLKKHKLRVLDIKIEWN